MPITESDLRPSEFPDRGDWQDALQKGLGRALLWAKNGLLVDQTIFLHACLSDLHYDGQCEEGRGPWLSQIMEAAGLFEDLREPIFQALGAINDGLDAEQLCQFCVSYAMRGDHRFRHGLQSIVSKKPASDCPWLGEEQLIQLDSDAGFLYVADVRARSLSQRGWEWDDEAMMRMAMENLGEQTAIDVLTREAESSPELRRFIEAWRTASEKKTGDPKQSHADRMRQYTLTNIIQAAEATPNQGAFLRGWGMHADECDLQVVLDRLFSTHDPRVIANYLRVFSNRPLPQFDDQMLFLLQHDNEEVRRRAYTAVAKNAHPAIRAFALNHLQSHYAEPNFIELFIHNFRSGDEDLLRTHLSLSDDRDDRHALLMDLTKVLEENPAARCNLLALWVYRWTPCTLCRHRAAKLLVTHNVAPQWLIEEIQYDSDPDTRRLIRKESS